MKNKASLFLSFFFLSLGFMFPCEGFAQYTGGPSSGGREDVTQKKEHILWQAKKLEEEVLAEKKIEEIAPSQEFLISTPSEEETISAEEPLVVHDERTVVPVEIDGDSVEFFQEERKVIVQGDVVVSQDNMRMRSDYVEYFYDTKEAKAKGNVVLTNPEAEITGPELLFNFESMKGVLYDATVVSLPYYGGGEEVKKVDDTKIEVAKGFVTTCDLDQPHYRLQANQVDVYPKDKVTAKRMTMRLGSIPVFFWPQYTMIMSDGRPSVVLVPGHDKEWGTFLLTAWRYHFNQNFKGNVHVDIRENNRGAVGLDNFYKTSRFGDGLIKTYYVSERNTNPERWKDNRSESAVDQDRYKALWRHHWQMDSATRAVWQYYRLSDEYFLKDYFKREYDQDPNPDTFFLLTRNFSKGLLSFRTDKRVNKHESRVERLPEIGYNFYNQEIGSTDVFLKSQNLYSNLYYPQAHSSKVDIKSHRVDSDNVLSYPSRLGFVDITPYVGERLTYYSDTQETYQDGSIRSIFKTGVDLSTKFYKTFDVQGILLGEEVNQLRHVVTPKISYLYVHEPSLTRDQIHLFDTGIDDLERQHKIVFGLENRFQTKRNDKTVDFLIVEAETNFLLKEDVGPSSFNNITTDVEFRPTPWLTFFSDTDYSAQERSLISANQEVQINSKDDDRWSLSLAKRYHRDYDDLVTLGLDYRLNPKWKVNIYERFDLDSGDFLEHQYTLTRDLHCWEMDVSLNHRKNEGSSVWVVFRIKAFPKMSFDLFKTSFNQRTVGSQR